MVRCILLCGLLTIFALAGCSSYDPANVAAKTYPARGKVVLADGTPLRGGKIILHPNDKTKPEAEGIIQKDGTFTLMTYKKGDGAVPGPHKITIDRFYYDKNGNPQENRALPIPKRYWKEDTTDLTTDIQDRDNVLELKLKPS